MESGWNDDWGCAVSKKYQGDDAAVPTASIQRVPFARADVWYSMTSASATDGNSGCRGRSIRSPIRSAANGDAGKHLRVKIDVEGAEWASLMATPHAVFEQIDQIALELHGVQDARYLATVKRLKQHFHVVNLNANNQACSPEAAPFSSLASQVLLVNKRIVCSIRRRPCRRPSAP